MAKTGKEKIIRKARTPMHKKVGVNCFFERAEKQDVMSVYEFIYGNKRHEYNTLIRGLELSCNNAKSKKEKLMFSSLLYVVNEYHRQYIEYKRKKYEEKYKETIDIAIAKAKKGSDLSIFDLVAFDKEFLYFSFVKDRIKVAQAEEDAKFFNLLGESVKRKGFLLDDKVDSKQKNLRNLLRRLDIVGYDFSKPDAPREIFSILDAANNSIVEENYPYPDHSGVLKKTLERIGLMNK